MTEATSTAKRPDPCAFVLFGPTGDLTHRLVIPALYNLAKDGLLPEPFCLAAIVRKPIEVAELRKTFVDGLHQFARQPVRDDIVDKLFRSLSCLRANDEDPSSFVRLSRELEQAEQRCGTKGNRLFYLATPPSAFLPIATALHKTGMLRETSDSWRRLIVEKPFGSDLASAKKLNADLTAMMDERQIFRIDHYLGKETVQNILALRFSNGMFEPIWNRNHIEHVQITVSETVSVGHRGAFYDATGALRDMVPNHLFQLMALTAMEPPAKFDAATVRAEKSDVLAAIHNQTLDEAMRNSVRAQYTAGRVKNEDVVAYRASPDVRPDSTTETFVALKLGIDNWRWAGVPFYLRTGKTLGEKRTEIAIKFLQVPFAIFPQQASKRLSQNYLVIGIEPTEQVSLQFNAKVPGPTIALDGVEMTFCYKDYFKVEPRTGYETLIYDCMIGDNLLFQSATSIEAGWKAVQPFLDAWHRAGSTGLVTYAAGSNGPKEANELLERDRRQWRTPA